MLLIPAFLLAIGYIVIFRYAGVYKAGRSHVRFLWRSVVVRPPLQKED
jgi:hypothetical protein